MKIIAILIFFINIMFANTTVLVSEDSQSVTVGQGVMNYYKISAQSEENIEIILNQLSADADLYVRLGSEPTKTEYDCRSTNGESNADTCTVTVLSNQDVFIGVYGYAQTVDYTITATRSPANIPETLTFDTALDASVLNGELIFYKVSAQNSQIITAEISNLLSDADIYVKVGAKPSTSSYDCRSTQGNSNTDSCSVTLNTNDDVYIGVHGYQATDYTVKVSAKESIVTLTSGVEVNSSIQQGRNTYYKIYGVAGQELIVRLDDLTDDADISLKEGIKPTDVDFDCKSNNSDALVDTCTYTLTQSGDVYIRVYGYRTTDYRLTATLTGDDVETLLSGVSISSSVIEGEMKYYKIPALFGEDIEAVLDLLTADADVYIKTGSKPTAESFDCKSSNGQTNADSCSVVSLDDQDVFIGVFGYRASDYRLAVTASSEPIPETPTILEDAEGGTLNPNWIHTLGNLAPYIVDTPNIPGAPAGEGVMVQLADGGAVTRNLYTLPVNNTTQKVLSMDCGGLPTHRFSWQTEAYAGYIAHYAVGVKVETKYGTRFMQWYSFYNHGNVAAFKEDNGANIFLNYPSPVETTSGYFQATDIWNHFEVNIETELQKLEPGNRLYKVINFFTTGGFLDNITLSSPQLD